MINRASIQATVEDYCRVQCEKDAAGWAALFAADVVHEDPVGIGQRHDFAQVVGQFWESIVSNDVHIWQTAPTIICGNEALAIMACEIGPRDQRRRIEPVVDHFIFGANGKIVSLRGFFNLEMPSG